MFVYLIILILGLLLLWVSHSKVYTNKLYKYVILFLTVIILFLVCVFRNISVGTDYKAYYFSFKFLTANELHNDFIEPGYILLNNIAQYFNNFLIIPSIVFIIIISSIIFIGHQIKLNCFIILSLFIITYDYFYEFNSLREFMAIGIVCFGIYFLLKFTNNKIIKYILFLLCVFIATKFHNTAIFSVLFIFIPSLIKYDKKTVVVSGIITTILFFTNIVQGFTRKLFILFPLYVAKYSNGSSGVTGFLHKGLLQYIPVLIQFIFLYIFVKNSNINNTKINYILCGYLLCLIMYSGSTSIILDRLQDYTYIFQLLYAGIFIDGIHLKGCKVNISSFNKYLFVFFWVFYFLLRLAINSNGIIPYEFI